MQAAHCWSSGAAERGVVGSTQEDVQAAVQLVLRPASMGEQRWFEGGGCENRSV